MCNFFHLVYYVVSLCMCCNCNEFVNVVHSLSALFGGFHTWSFYRPISFRSLLKSPCNIFVCVVCMLIVVWMVSHMFVMRGVSSRWIVMYRFMMIINVRGVCFISMIWRYGNILFGVAIFCMLPRKE
jgi:hypothetical protein